MSRSHKTIIHYFSLENVLNWVWGQSSGGRVEDLHDITVDRRVEVSKSPSVTGTGGHSGVHELMLGSYLSLTAFDSSRR